MNTYGRLKRFMLQVCISGFTLWMNIWSSSGKSPQWVGVIISIIILQPVQMILEKLAAIKDPPCCLALFRLFTDFFFYAIAFGFAFVFWLIAGLGLKDLSSSTNVRSKLLIDIFLSICVSAVKVQIFDIPNWLVSDWKKIPFMHGFNPDFGIFDLFKCPCFTKAKSVDINAECHKNEKKVEQKKKGCCCKCRGCCCGMFSQSGFWFLVGMALGFPAVTYAGHKEWFQNHPATDTQPAYRKGVVRVDDPNLLTEPLGSEDGNGRHSHHDAIPSAAVARGDVEAAVADSRYRYQQDQDSRLYPQPRLNPMHPADTPTESGGGTALPRRSDVSQVLMGASGGGAHALRAHAPHGHGHGHGHGTGRPSFDNL
jgi:hypothetical protein